MYSRRTRILSVGIAVPDKLVANSEFEEYLDTSDEWIVKRTGIRTRYVCGKDTPEAAADLGARAARVAMDRAGVSAEQLDGVICATFTPDNFFPSTACGIADRIGCPTRFAFDLSAACSGFIYGLSVASALIASGQCEAILLVGSEVISRGLDWNDRGTCILFGDGAGAVVLQAGDRPDVGVLATTLGADSSQGAILALPAWGEKRVMVMNGNEVYKRAVRMMSDSALKSLEACSLTYRDIDLLVPHQANIRIIEAVARMMQVPAEKVVANVDRYGNTSSASIPIALDYAWQQGRVVEGTTVVFSALGGGLTSASAVVRF